MSGKGRHNLAEVGAETAPRQGPLSSVRILAIENYLAGNYGSYLMARLGAEVIKIEVPGDGDALRLNPPFVRRGDAKRSHGELRLMGGKKSIELDLASAPGKQELFELVPSADVVWSNLKPQSLERLGITYEHMAALNPRIIFTTISGFGHTDLLPAGPASGLGAFDIIAQGMAGLMFRTEAATDAPAYNGLPLGDQVTSIFAVVGTITALFERELTGVGQRVDVAMYDCMLALNEKPIALYSMTGKIPRRGESPTSAPYGAYRTSDGYVCIAVGGNPVWRRFCKAIQRDDLVDDSRFALPSDRVANSGYLNTIVSDWTKSKTRADVIVTMSNFGVPAGPLYNVDDIVQEPQAVARRMIQTYQDPLVGSVRVAGNPIKMTRLPDVPPEPPHALGEDNGKVSK